MYKLVMGIAGVLCVASSSCKALRPAAAAQTPAGVDIASGVPDTSGKYHYTPTGRDVISVLLHAKGTVEATEWKTRSVGLAPGYVKRGTSIKYAGYLTAYFTDDEGNKLDSAFFESPLTRRVEAPITDDGQLATVIQQRTEGVAFVRANYQEAMTELHIYDAAGKKTAVLKLKKP